MNMRSLAICLMSIVLSAVQYEASGNEKGVFGLAVYRREQLVMPQDGEYRCFELREAVSDLEKRMKTRINAFNKRESDLQTKANEVSQKNEASQRNDSDIAELMKEREILKIDKQILQRQFEQEQMELGRAFEQKIDRVVSDIRRARKLTLIHCLIPGDSADESLDITDEIVEALNEEYRKEQRAKKLKASAAPAAKSAVPAKA